MSLNQLTNPSSKFPIYGRTISVPPLVKSLQIGPDPVPDLITLETPAATAVTITSKIFRLGDLYTIICRAKFTATVASAIVFDLNIPGFAFAAGEGETATAIKNGAFPNMTLDANANGMIVDGVMVDAQAKLRLLYTRYTAGTTAVNSVIGEEYDISFTMNAVAGPIA